MSNLNITTGTSYTPFASSALNALANGAYVLDSVGFDNSSGLMTAMDLGLVFGTAFTPTGGTISVFIVPALDGTNYAAPGNSAALPPASLLAGTYTCVAVSTTVIPILSMAMSFKAKCKLLLWNNSGTALPSGTITATAYPKTFSMV